jgi:hypothetical protein
MNIFENNLTNTSSRMTNTKNSDHNNNNFIIGSNSSSNFIDQMLNIDNNINISNLVDSCGNSANASSSITTLHRLSVQKFASDLKVNII